ncbi:MAG: hypothetical protein U9Q33_10180 [Campylobacterota bacterium]|nr:hypothetical protein [Campylobacterota bacterium]
MNVIIAIEDLIKTNQKRIKTLKSQIDDHESGKEKMSAFAYASMENALEESTKALEKNKLIHEELLKKDLQEIEKETRIKQAVTRKNYFKYQKTRIKRNNGLDANQKLEAMLIIDELPSDLNFEDQDIFNIAAACIKLDLRVHEELEDDLNNIKNDFEALLSKVKQENITDLDMIRTYIPILVLHLKVLVDNIIEDTEKENTCFRGLPRYQDWWINELWHNHQAYFGLYKWKDIVSFLCVSGEQKEAWEVIFSNWVFIKKLINKKGYLAYEFMLVFDQIMEKYTGLEEELELDNIQSMDQIVQNITKKEDFHTFKHKHNISTEYLEFKQNRFKSNL